MKLAHIQYYIGSDKLKKKQQTNVYEINYLWKRYTFDSVKHKTVKCSINFLSPMITIDYTEQFHVME